MMPLQGRFPKGNVLTDTTVVVCQGMARRFKLPVRGRRNAFGLWQGKRTDIWQSGTTPSLAIPLRSNSHTMPNYRVPLTPAIHTAVCSCSSCKNRGKDMLDKLPLKTIAKSLNECKEKAQAIIVATRSKVKSLVVNIS